MKLTIEELIAIVKRNFDNGLMEHVTDWQQYEAELRHDLEVCRKYNR